MEKIHIIPVRDIGDDKKWVQHITNLAPEFHNVYTGENKGYIYIKQLFEKAQIDVTVLKNILNIEASTIREAIKTKNDMWKTMIHPSTITFIENNNRIDRIKNIHKSGTKKT